MSTLPTTAQTYIEEECKKTRGLIPEGVYAVQCVWAKQIVNSKGDGVCIKARFSILAPSNEGDLFDVYYNIERPSKKAVEVSLIKLAQFTKAAKLVEPLTDDQQLVGLCCSAYVTESEGKMGIFNDIKNYQPIEPGHTRNYSERSREKLMEAGYLDLE